MGKYGFDLRMKVVNEYLQGIEGHKVLTEKYNLADQSQVKNWFNVYKKFGIDDLWCSRQNNFYSFELKLNAVELYLSDEASSQELAFTLEWISFDLCRTAQCWLDISILTSGSSLMKSKTNTLFQNARYTIILVWRRVTSENIWRRTWPGQEVFLCNKVDTGMHVDSAKADSTANVQRLF